jgi:hypothetical protein
LGVISENETRESGAEGVEAGEESEGGEYSDEGMESEEEEDARWSAAATTRRENEIESSEGNDPGR